MKILKSYILICVHLHSTHENEIPTAHLVAKIEPSTAAPSYEKDPTDPKKRISTSQVQDDDGASKGFPNHPCLYLPPVSAQSCFALDDSTTHSATGHHTSSDSKTIGDVSAGPDRPHHAYPNTARGTNRRLRR